MAQFFIVLTAMVVLVAMSRLADSHFRQEDRLPMQWLLDGTVTWTAPRRVALAFTPVLAACVLTVIAGLPLFLEPRAGQEWMEVPVILGVALLFVGIHALHLFMIGKTLRTGR